MDDASTIQYNVHPTLGFPSAVTDASGIRTLRAARRFHIDFSRCQHFEPFGMLVVGSAVRSLQARTLPDGAPVHVTIGFDETKQGHQYAAAMNFWESIGVEFPCKEGLPNATDRYVRITKLTVAGLYQLAAGADPIRSEVVSHRAAELAKVLGGDNQDFLVALEFTFRELIRNCIEHSRSDAMWFAAATRPSMGDVQVAILDEGCGIRTSLISGGAYNPANDSEAIDLALKPGVSRNVGKMLSPERIAHLYNDFPDQDPMKYENSGYGLTFTSNIALRAGQFAIVSGDASFATVGGTVHSSANHVGTAVRIVLQPSKLGPALDDVFKGSNFSRSSSTRRDLVSASMMRRLGIVKPEQNPG